MKQNIPKRRSTKLNKIYSDRFPFQIYLPKLWLTYVIVLFIVTTFMLQKGINIETNILSLLPNFEQEVLLQKSVERFSSQVNRKLFFMIGHQNANIARKMAFELSSDFEKNENFKNVRYQVDSQTIKHWYDFYFPLRYQIISPEIKSILQQPDAAESLLKRLFQQLSSPLPMHSGEMLKKDPLLFFNSFVESMPQSPGKLEVVNEMLSVVENGETYIFIDVTLLHNPFDISKQTEITHFLEQTINRVKSEYSDSEVLYTGVFKFAAAGSAEAQKEVSTIGLGSLLGVIFLMFITFRSFRTIFISILPILIGILSALGVSLLFFQKIHLLTLVFGASLTGVSIDYAFHYLVKHRLTYEKWNNWRSLKTIFLAITMGLITSILGYGGFYLTPFPALQQIAIFSIVGLLGAYGTVICWFPVFYKSPTPLKTPPLMLHPARLLLNLWKIPKNLMLLILSLVSVGIVCIVILEKAQYNDDIRALENLSPSLKLEDAKIRGLVGGLDVSRFIIIRGQTEEQLLERQALAVEQLKNILNESRSLKYQTFAAFVPAQKTIRENIQITQSLIISQKEVIFQGLSNLGFEEKIQHDFYENVLNSRQSFTLQSWLESPVSEAFRHLWLDKIGDEYVSMIMLENNHDSAAIINSLKNIEGVEYVNQVARISSLFTQYREETLRFVILAYALIWGFLQLKYTFGKSLLILLPPALSTLLTFTILTLMGQELNIFNIVSALLILGIGVDYTIFFAECEHASEETALAILLSAITTLLSFGLLFLSQTPAIASVGMTITLGICITLLLSPLANTDEI